MQNIIKSVRYFPYRIPLHAQFVTTHGVLLAREGAIVEIITNDGLSGIGEIAPLPEFAGDDLHTTLAPLPLLCEQLLNKTLPDALDFLYANIHSLPATTMCGLEIALLDALGKHSLVKSSLYALIDSPVITSGNSSFGARMSEEGKRAETRQGDEAPDAINQVPTWNGSSVRDGDGGFVRAVNDAPVRVVRGVAVNAVIGVQDIENVLTRAHKIIAAGFQCIKLKMGADLEQDIARVAAIRNAIGPAVHLRLDANEAWNFEQAVSALSRCAAYDIQYIEQPLPAGDLEGMRKLRQTIPVPIAADEAVYDLKSVRRILDVGAADILIIKPQLAGGLRAGREIITEASAHGVQCVITSTIETGIGVVAALHLAAASPEVTLECGLATLHLLTNDLLLDDLSIENGMLTMPAGPGLGVRLDRVALAQYISRIPGRLQ